MFRKLIFLTSCLLLVGVASAATVWNPAANGIVPPATGDWGDAANWTNGLPDAVEKAVFNVPGAAECQVTDAQSFNQLVQGDGADGGVIRVQNGGSLTTTTGWSAVGYNSTAHTIVDAGGTMTFGEHAWIGLDPGAVGTLDISGTVNVTGMFGAGWGGGIGYVNVLDGGLLALANIHGDGATSIKGGSLLDIIGTGAVTLPGDFVGVIDAYAAAGLIAGDGILGAVQAVVADGVTTVTAVLPPIPTFDIPIVNAGFEDPVLAEDDWTWLDVPGWTPVGGEGPGIWNITNADFDPVVAPEGQNVLYTENAVGDAGGVAQVLAENFAANTDYTLTAEVGNSWEYYWSGYSVQLLAGGIVIAEDNDTLWPDYMKWATSTVQYTYDSADSALVGQPLEIRLLTLALDKDNPPAGEVVGVEFDNVTLSSGEPNEPALLTNGDFEADLALVPNPGDTDANAPTGWEYDRYYGYDVDPWLMNVSAIGDGSGGNVGVVFGTWNADAAWNPAVAAYPESAVEAGQYTLEVTTVSTGGAGEGWLDVQLGWLENPADPWANYDEYVREWVDVSLFGDGVWTTLTWDFEIPADDPGVGMNWYLWLVGESYNDYVIVGDVKLTAAEPGVTIHVDPNGDIAAANEIAKAGDTIEFAEGTYYLTSQIEIKDGVTYKGAGPGLTIIDGNDVTRAFVAWGDRGATDGQVDVNGISVPNVTGPTGWVLDGLTIQNCVADSNDRFSYTGSAFDMNDVFAENDTDGSGGLNPEEANADSGGIRLPGPDGTEGTEDDDLHRFAHMDTDGNGELSQAELLAQIAVAEDEFGDESRDGGAVFCGNGAVGTIQNCEFLNNSTPIDGDDGGAVLLSGLSVVTINDCLFDGNYAVSPDGVKLDGVGGQGGHIRLQGGSASAITPGTTLIANRCFFLNGKAEDDGAAIQSGAVGSIIRLDACWFEGNTAADDGTVLFIGNNQSHELTVTNCVFANNISAGGSDKMCHVKRNAKFVNCTFVDNNQDDLALIQNTANNIDTDGDGENDELADTTQVVNCIFLNNVVGNGDDVLKSRNNNFTIAATNCLFFGNTLQNGNAADNTQRPAEETGSVLADPLLDAGYVPGAGSPAIDAGVDPATVGVTLTTDYNGDTRPQGAAYDIGAFESVDAPSAN